MKIQAFRPPFTYDGYSYVWDKDSKMVLMFTSKSIDNDDREKIVRKLNGNQVEGFSLSDIKYSETEYHSGGLCIMWQRGWGYLTGSGGLNLSGKEARKIQEEFAHFVVNSLSK